MALTRKMLKAMGIEDEKIDQIIEAHTETTDGLKADLAKYQADGAKLAEVQKKLDEANKKLEAAGDGGFEEKYKQVKKDFDDYKKTQTAKEARTAKENAYRDLLKAAGISEKRLDSVLKVSDVDGIELVDGKIKDADKLTKVIQSDWADFIVTTHTQGAQTATPPAQAGAGTMTKDQIMGIKDRSERRAAIAANMNLFGKGE